MSDFVSNLGTFKPTTFSGDKPKSRMAGDYMSEFTQKYSDNSQRSQVNNRKDFNTSKGDNGKSYGTNTEKMLFGKTPNSSANNNASNPNNINTKAPKQAAMTAPNNTYNNKNPDGSFKSAVHEFAEGQGYDQDAFLNKRYSELDASINNYEGPRGFSDDSNLENQNNTQGRADNVMAFQGFKNNLKERNQIQRQLNTSQGLDADFNLPENPQWYQQKQANQIAGQNAAVAAAQQYGGKKKYPEFKKGSSKLTDYP